MEDSEKTITIVIDRITNDHLRVRYSNSPMLAVILDEVEARELSIALRAMVLHPECLDRSVKVKYWTNDEAMAILDTPATTQPATEEAE